MRGNRDAKSVAVLHDRVRSKAELCRLSFALLQELGFRCGRALVGVVAALFSGEVHPGIAASRPLLIILGPEALHACPCLNESAISAEVLVTDPLLLPGNLHNGSKEEFTDLVL